MSEKGKPTGKSFAKKGLTGAHLATCESHAPEVVAAAKEAYLDAVARGAGRPANAARKIVGVVSLRSILRWSAQWRNDPEFLAAVEARRVMLMMEVERAALKGVRISEEIANTTTNERNKLAAASNLTRAIGDFRRAYGAGEERAAQEAERIERRSPDEATIRAQLKLMKKLYPRLFDELDGDDPKDTDE